MKLTNHVCTDTAVNGVKFTAKIITPKGKANARTLQKLKADPFIVVHNTGNSAATAGDDNHAAYLQNVENADAAYISWHITVDADSAIQHLPFDEVGYHAGDGSGNGNRRGIGIEIAENYDYPTCEANGIKIICALMRDYNVPIERVQPHRYFAPNKKLCPWRILKSQATWESDWAAFQKRIVSVYNSLYGTAAPATPAQPIIPTTPAQTMPPATTHKTGDIVQFTGGAVYSSANADIPAHSRGKSRCKVTQVYSGKYPYHLVSEDGGGVYGWVGAMDIQAADSAVAQITSGSKVKIKQGAKYYTGGAIPSWVMSDTWIVSQIAGDRAVLGKNVSGKNNINSPVKVNDLALA